MINALRNAARWMAAACLSLVITLAHAAVPAAINYQGFLTNPSTGAPLTTAVGVPLFVTFNLWDDAIQTLTSNPPATLVYSETQSVTVTNGVFNVQIGSGTVPSGGTAFTSVAFDKPYWLEIVVGTGKGTQLLTPRQPLTSAPYAMRAANLTSDINSNTAGGSGALATNTTGTNNTASGYQALFSNTTGSKNTALGSGALFTQSYSNNNVTWDALNTAVGYQALHSNQRVPLTVGLGTNSYLNGTQNTAVGASALSTNTIGYGNSALGVQALNSNTTGSGNTAVGSFALFTQSFSNNNALWASDNTAVGYMALYANQPVTVSGLSSGTTNTAIGSNALMANTVGAGNTAVGFDALMSNTTGRGNIAIGSGAGSALTTGYGNIDIFDAGVAGESSTIRIGTPGTQTDTYLAGTLHATGLRFAGGSHAISSNDGCFTWADSNAFDYSCAQNNAFTVRATGGVFFTTAINVAGTPTAGVQLPAGSGSWSSMSDRNSKTNVMAVDGLAVLQKLVAMPVSSWNYKTQDASIRHMGPMAQDFHAAFGVGEDEKHIATVDEGGVALAAIQGLYKTLVAKDREIARIKKKASLLERELAVIKTKLGLQ